MWGHRDPQALQMGVHIDSAILKVNPAPIVKLSVCTPNDPVILFPGELAWVHKGISRRLLSAAFLGIMSRR